MYCPTNTVHAALRRYATMQEEYMDLRKFNGRNNHKLKIVPRIRNYLLDPQVLQRWGNLCLQQRCVQLKNDLDVVIHPNTLRDFYLKNNIRNRAVGFTY